MWCSLQLYANSSPIFLFICSCRVWSSCDCIKTLIPKVNVIQTSLLCFFRYSLVYVDSMASSFSFFFCSSSSILAFYMIIIKDWHINDSVFSNTKPNFSMTCLFFFIFSILPYLYIHVSANTQENMLITNTGFKQNGGLEQSKRWWSNSAPFCLKCRTKAQQQ